LAYNEISKFVNFLKFHAVLTKYIKYFFFQYLDASPYNLVACKSSQNIQQIPHLWTQGPGWLNELGRWI